MVVLLFLFAASGVCFIYVRFALWRHWDSAKCRIHCLMLLSPLKKEFNTQTYPGTATSTINEAWNFLFPFKTTQADSHTCQSMEVQKGPDNNAPPLAAGYWRSKTRCQGAM